VPSKQERCRSTFFLVSLECFRKKLEPRRCIRVSSLTRRIHARLVHAGWCLKAKRADKGGILLSSCAPHIILLALAYLVLRARRGSSFMICHTSSFILDIPLPSASSIPSCFVTPLPSFSTYLFHLPLPSASSTDVKELPTSLHLSQCHDVGALPRCNVASEAPYYLLSTKYEIRTQPRRAES